MPRASRRLQSEPSAPKHMTMSFIRAREVIVEEISLAKSLLRSGGYEQSMRHLERAHVLGQRSIGTHVSAHWLMLRVAVARRDPGAALGQIARIVLGAIGSAVGVLPVGNTGGSDVDMFRKMPIPPELALLLDALARP